jgi:hypothetical protein
MNADKLFGAAAAYMLLGILWTYFYPRLSISRFTVDFGLCIIWMAWAGSNDIH